VTDLLTIGDSWVEVDEPWKWPALIGCPPILCQGIGGTYARDWAEDQNGMLSKALCTDCDNVFVGVGGNDIMEAICDLQRSGDLGQFQAAVSETWRNVRRVLAAFSDQRTRYLMAYDADWRTQPFYAVAARVGNTTLATIAREYGATFARFDQVLRGSGDFDGIHPSKQGHAKLAAYMGGIL
jgi:lysophospholipase L1-like esterase